MAPIDLPRLKARYDDEPETAARQRADDYNSHVVPASGRVPRWQLTMSAWSTLSAMVWLFYGALVAGLYGTRQALIGLAVAIAAYGVVTPLYAAWAANTGLSSALLSRRMFGVVGSALTALLLAATTTYYTVFESSTLAVAMRSYTGHLDLKLWYLIVVAVMIPLMISGVQTWMGKLNALLLPLYVVGLAGTVVAAAVKHGLHSHWLSFPGIVPESARPVPGWMLVVVLYLGLTLMMPVAADFTRFSRKQDVRFHRNITWGVPYYLWLYGINGVAGIYLTQTMLPNPATDETGVVAAVLAAAGLFGLLFIIITQTRINSLNYYLSSLNWDRLVRSLTGRRLPRPVWVGIVAVAVFFLMLTDVFSYLQTALTWQGICMVGWVGIVGTHLALVRADRKGGPEFRAGRLPAVSPGLGVWAVATAVGIWLVQDHGAPRTLAALAPAVVLVISMVLYAATLLIWPARRTVTRPDPRTAVDDAEAAYITCDSCRRSYIAREMDSTGTAQVVCDECVTAFRFHGKALNEVGAPGERHGTAEPATSLEA